MALPPSYTYGYVLTRAVQNVSDGPDPDRLPDGIAARGSVTFTPIPADVRKVVEPDYKAYVVHKSATALIWNPAPNDEPPYTSPKGKELVPGIIVDSQGEPGIWLTTGDYVATYSLTSGGSIKSVEFTVSEEHTEESPLWLEDVGPFVPTPGQPVTTLVVPSPVPGGLLVWRDGSLAWSPAAADLEALAEQAGIDADRAETAVAGLDASIQDAVDTKVPAAVDQKITEIDLPALVGDEISTLAGPAVQAEADARVDPLVTAASGSATAAAGSASSAALSATSAAGSADAAGLSATAAAGSASDAGARKSEIDTLWTDTILPAAAAVDAAQTATEAARDAAQAAQTATENALPAFEQAIADALDVLIGEIE